MVIGVLALQGAFVEHIEMLDKIGVESLEVRTEEDLDKVQGMILPGGESTVMGKLLNKLNLMAPLKSKIDAGMPVWGTCAGMILLSRNHEYLSTMAIDVKRNAYGNQSGSFSRMAYIEALKDDYEMVFIRAPYITATTEEVLVKVDDNIVAVRQKHMLATSFHPEVTKDTKFHEYFIEMVRNRS